MDDWFKNRRFLHLSALCRQTLVFRMLLENELNRCALGAQNPAMPACVLKNLLKRQRHSISVWIAMSLHREERVEERYKLVISLSRFAYNAIIIIWKKLYNKNITFAIIRVIKFLSKCLQIIENWKICWEYALLDNYTQYIVVLSSDLDAFQTISIRSRI